MCNNKKNILYVPPLSWRHQNSGHILDTVCLNASVWWKPDTKLFRQRLSEPHSSTTPSPKPTPAPVPGTAARCTLWILGRWAGPATREVKWSSACDLYSILLLPISTSLLHIITWPVVTYYYYLLLHCYYIIITHYYMLLQFLLLHCYYIIIPYYYIIHYYLFLHFLLLYCYYIIIMYYYIFIITIIGIWTNNFQNIVDSYTDIIILSLVWYHTPMISISKCNDIRAKIYVKTMMS